MHRRHPSCNNIFNQSVTQSINRLQSFKKINNQLSSRNSYPFCGRMVCLCMRRYRLRPNSTGTSSS